ncbi:MAG: glycosyltransferase [Methanothrix sp.]|jgi:hypothetical protein|nr:glycosyltransferase [Methanothrix sp.]
MSNELIVSAPVYGASGYAEISRNLVLGLYRKGINIKLEPSIYEIHDVIEEPELSILKSLEKTVFDNSFIPPKLNIGIAPWFDIKYKGYKIGYTMFEFNNLPNIDKYNWYNSCINMNEIWVPSFYNFNTFKENGIDNVFVYPIGIDLKKFKKTKKNKEEFVFLSVGEFNYRKGWEILLNSFVQEFDNSDNVKLVIKSFEHDKFKNDYEKRIINLVEDIKKQKSNCPKIEVITNIYNYNKIQKIYKNVDVFVMATLGEGFGLPMAEAMACGIPCILPNNSAYLDFVNNENGWLVDINGYKKDNKISEVSISYFNSLVPDINIDCLKKYMRESYQNIEMVKNKGDRSQKMISSKFELESTIDTIYNRLLNIPNISSLNKKTIFDGFEELEIDNMITDIGEIDIRGLKKENIGNTETYIKKFLNTVVKLKNEIENEIESLDENNIELRRKLMKKRCSIHKIIRSYNK